MHDLETNMMINKMKCLLNGLERYIGKVSLMLDVDDIADMPEKTKYMHEYINKIEEKINSYKEKQNVEDELM